MTAPSGKKAEETALEGIKVADFTWALTGPILTKHLTDYGATVVRVESPLATGVCPLRVSIPFKDNKPGICNQRVPALQLRNESPPHLKACGILVSDTFTGCRITHGDPLNSG